MDIAKQKQFLLSEIKVNNPINIPPQDLIIGNKYEINFNNSYQNETYNEIIKFIGYGDDEDPDSVVVSIISKNNDLFKDWRDIDYYPIPQEEINYIRKIEQ